MPRVPAGGLSENSRKQMNHSRESTCQILKAAMAINSITLSEMEVPDSYLDALPKVQSLLSVFCFNDYLLSKLTIYCHFSTEEPLWET